MDDLEVKITILCLGPKGSGKTTLLKKLQDAEGIDYTYSPVPTIGTNIYDVPCLNRQGKRQLATVREVGGEMASLWDNYYDGIEKVIFVVDTSNLCQISAASVMLYTLLAEPRLKNAKVNDIERPTVNLWRVDGRRTISVCKKCPLKCVKLGWRYSSNRFILVLSKMDAAYRQMRNEALLMLQFARLSTELKNAPVLLEASPLTGVGLEELRNHIAENKRPPVTIKI